MRRAGFRDDISVPVDLIVPEHVAAKAGRRGARLPGGHGRTAARKSAGVEGALVDHDPVEIASMEPADPRRLVVKVAVAKAAVCPMENIGSRVVAERPQLILVLDEFAGSGRQISRVVDQLIDQLRYVNSEWSETTKIGVGIGVVAGPEPQRRLGERQCEPAVGVTLGAEVRAFDEKARIFESEPDREAARDLCSAIGRSLDAQPALGFGDQGLLVAFESNCPNNSLPALWKSGNYGGRPWVPVFERLESRDRNASE